MASERRPSSDSTDVQALRARFEAHGQGHVFRFWDRLDAAGRDRLARQAAGIDLPAVLRGYARTQEAEAAAAGKLEPVEVVASPAHGGDAAAHRDARERGEAMLREGRVGVMVVAGGQATRLGYPGPKGAFPLGPVSDRSLFAIHAQKIRRLRERAGQPIPWYVMTSEATDEPTRTFFAEHDHFGLPEEDIFFLVQRMVPSFDFEGRLMLERPDRIFENPDGHGGSLTALASSGALDDMERRGIDTLFYFQVDNGLVRIADPAFLGFHAAQGAEMSCKVVRKEDPGEKVGVVARVDGRVGVVEYTEIDDAHRNARDASGELVYWTGSIAVHVFDVPFIRRVAAEAETQLPFHASAKAIPCVDDEGETRKPDAPNGHKLERFVFDALAAAKRVMVMETPREDEYSPVKNAEGSDSPATARRDLSACYRRWLEAAGVAAPAGAVLEIDHARVDGAEDVRALGIRDAADASDVIRIAPGDPT
ncbi:MAG: UTP--glucose-1-phosphate uridylyltransferase [Myxococcota bacterium]